MKNVVEKCYLYFIEAFGKLSPALARYSTGVSVLMVDRYKLL